VFEQVRGEGMAERVGRGPLREASPPDRGVDHALEHGLVQVVPPPLTGRPVHVEARGGKGHCHAHSRPAFAYFWASAVGSSTSSRRTAGPVDAGLAPFRDGGRGPTSRPPGASSSDPYRPCRSGPRSDWPRSPRPARVAGSTPAAAGRLHRAGTP